MIGSPKPTKKPKGVQKSLPQLKKMLQRLVNKYVRLRDALKPCISCMSRQVEHAGHFIAQGASGALRFNEKNISGQCSQCNVWKRGNLILYRINLVKRIGEDEVKELESHIFDVKKWTREELVSMIEEYKLKIKNLDSLHLDNKE